jgi:hypothetical protein
MRRQPERVSLGSTNTSLSSPGSTAGPTGRSSKHRPGVLDCPVKPGNDAGGNK